MPDHHAACGDAGAGRDEAAAGDAEGRETPHLRYVHGRPGRDARHHESEAVQAGVRRQLREGHGTALLHLTHDDKRLVVTDYFLNQDDFGKVHLEGDHKVHVLDVKEKSLTVDPAFQAIDFNTAFSTGRRAPTGSA